MIYMVSSSPRNIAVRPRLAAVGRGEESKAVARGILFVHAEGVFDVQHVLNRLLDGRVSHSRLLQRPTRQAVKSDPVPDMNPIMLYETGGGVATRWPPTDTQTCVTVMRGVDCHPRRTASLLASTDRCPDTIELLSCNYRPMLAEIGYSERCEGRMGPI